MSNSPVNKNLRHQEVVEDKTGGTDSFNIPEIAIENKDEVHAPVEVKGSEPIVLDSTMGSSSNSRRKKKSVSFVNWDKQKLEGKKENQISENELPMGNMSDDKTEVKSTDRENLLHHSTVTNSTDDETNQKIDKLIGTERLNDLKKKWSAYKYPSVYGRRDRRAKGR